MKHEFRYIQNISQNQLHMKIHSKKWKNGIAETSWICNTFCRLIIFQLRIWLLTFRWSSISLWLQWWSSVVMMIRNEDLMFENINLFEYQAETLQGLERVNTDPWSGWHAQWSGYTRCCWHSSWHSLYSLLSAEPQRRLRSSDPSQETSLCRPGIRWGEGG